MFTQFFNDIINFYHFLTNQDYGVTINEESGEIELMQQIGCRQSLEDALANIQWLKDDSHQT